MDKKIRDSLLELGMKPNFTDMNQTDDDGWTPADFAAEAGHPEVIKALAKHVDDLDKTNATGENLLEIARENSPITIAYDFEADETRKTCET